LPLLNLRARIPVCGVIAHYNEEALTTGPDRLPLAMSTVLQKRIRMQGFIILDHYGERFDTFRREMAEWVAAGRVKHREHVVDGLQNAPGALIDLLEGRNFGKVVVRVADA
jgi:NADPH-dependent curcumin reductase